MIRLTSAAAVLFICFSPFALGSETVGDVRVEFLSPTLVRLEVKGPKGFEDRQTFHVVNRKWQDIDPKRSEQGDDIALRGERFIVHVSTNAKSLKGTRIESIDGQQLWSFDDKLANNVWLPGPAETTKAWAVADTPRLARNQGNDPNTPEGWDSWNDAADVYVFLPGGDPIQLRRDFLKLTGPTDMPPLFALGAWDSRWYAYTAQTALQQIDDYRKRQIPLDVLVIDTDWRKGGSHGYDVNTGDFPDVQKFFKEAHDKHVRIMFNDHPEPISDRALDPKEMAYRFDHLSKLLNEGLDVWWFDRNWRTHLLSPMPGLRLEAWGMEVYHDATLAVRPNQRPMIMANVDGIDNGQRHQPPDMAVHRYPIQWTGDIGPSFAFLRKAVENAVHAGVAAPFAYESDDLGGHTSDPTPEGYIRWIEYGALSPIYRPHCTKNLKRMPWAFGDEAEKVAREYVQMRYRLLPVLYAAAHENYETGEPILRRCDLDYPQFKEASRDDEYLLGHNILVAPVLSSMNNYAPLPGSLLHTLDGQPGLAAEYFDNRDLNGEPVVKRIDPAIDFDWGEGSPDPKVPNDNWSARWSGKLGPIPDDGSGDRILAMTSDDGVRVWIDGEEVIDDWKGQESTTNEAKIPLHPGRTYDIKIEYMDMQFTAVCKMRWRRAKEETLASRQLWLPPGTWIDAWSGETIRGPKSMEVKMPLERIPMFIQSGAIIPLAPDMQYTGETTWDPITLDVYPAGGGKSEALLYEDDGISNAYQSGANRQTRVRATCNASKVNVTIDSAVGTFDGARAGRAWVVRVHLPAGMKATGADVDGQNVELARIDRAAAAAPFAVDGGSPDASIVELHLASKTVSAKHQLSIGLAAE